VDHERRPSGPFDKSFNIVVTTLLQMRREGCVESLQQLAGAGDHLLGEAARRCGAQGALDERELLQGVVDAGCSATRRS
jgi:hypothetical protein